MDPANLASILEILAKALRNLPASSAIVDVNEVATEAKIKTISNWLELYEKIILTRGYKDQTIKNRRCNLLHVQRLWGECEIANLRPHQIASALKTFSKEHSSTAVRVLSELRDIYVEAIANGWAESSPAAHIKAPKHKVMRERLTLETWSKMYELSATSPQRWVRSMLLLGVVIGQRRGDLAKVRFDDVVDGHLRIEQQKEAGKGYGARLEIPLALRLDCVDMTLGDVIEHCRNSAKPGPTLLRQSGGNKIEASSLSARFCEHIKIVLGKKDPGLYRRPSLHEMRSLSARQYCLQGIDPKVVQTLLGHSDIEMTEMYLNDRGLSSKQWKRVIT